MSTGRWYEWGWRGWLYTVLVGASGLFLLFLVIGTLAWLMARFPAVRLTVLAIVALAVLLVCSLLLGLVMRSWLEAERGSRR